MNRVTIINALIQKKSYQSYLEIGVDTGACFNSINCPNKTGVDPSKEVLKNVPGCIVKTSDDFFKQNKQTFDIIFIDGLHHYQQVYRDILNSLKVLNKGGTIVCHDMLPPDEMHQKVPRQQIAWTGDCWKAWVILRGTRSDLNMYVINTDYGCGIIQKGRQNCIEYSKLNYSSFLANKEKWMNIKQSLQILNNVLSIKMKKILITGGSGFLADALIKRLLDQGEIDITILARNEGNLLKTKQTYPHVKIITGDIADEFICKKALPGIDTLFHLAAFKHVGLAENQPVQCVHSNTLGTLNLLENFKGKLFVAISTDKAAQVVGVYGASKLLMERTIKEYEEINKHINYRVVRYGNVLYSTGSVLCKWKELLQKGKEIIVTDPEATRYFWSIEQAIDLIFDCIKNAKNSTPYCPVMKSIKIKDLLNAMQLKYGKANNIKIIGLQPGENKHEKILEDGITSDKAEKYTISEIMSMI